MASQMYLATSSRVDYVKCLIIPLVPLVQNQATYIQEQLAKAREEQRVREMELQKRRMRSMNVAEAKPPTSIDSLIGLSDMSPSTKRRPPTQQRPPPTNTAPQVAQVKPRAWTMDTANFQGTI